VQMKTKAATKRNRSDARTGKRKKGWQGPGPGRKRLGSKYVMVAIPKAMLAELDEWIAGEPDKPIYPEAIRRLMRLGMEQCGKNKSKG
jgi:hypothetical protein